MRSERGTLQLGVCFSRFKRSSLYAVGDSIWAGDIQDRKSTSSSVFKSEVEKSAGALVNKQL